MGSPRPFKLQQSTIVNHKSTIEMMQALKIFLIVYPIAATLLLILLRILVRRGRRNASRIYPPRYMKVVYKKKLVKELDKKSVMMKVFELRWNSIDEKEWIAAETNIQALKEYCSLTGMHIHELDDKDCIIEVPENLWSEMTITNTEYDPEDPDDWETMTFKEFMKNITSPTIIAGSMYD